MIVQSGLTEPGEDTALVKSRQRPLEGAVDGVARLVQASGGRLWIVSKAGSGMRARTWQWMAETDFLTVTGLDASQVRFCQERHEKAGICAELGIDRFLDDRVDVLEFLRPIVPQLFHFSPDPEGHPTPRWARRVADWSAAVEQLLAD